MLVWGYRGAPSDDDILSPEEARSLLITIVPDGPELALERRQRLIDNTAAGTDALRPQFDLLAKNAASSSWQPTSVSANWSATAATRSFTRSSRWTSSASTS